ncbi:hypothetical protein ACIOJE_34830 [Kitasatospora sp. NPDC087861]|uniref:hypothetical protein n=1 Tax=Kitasatospora sp. NPDC087861 TaxID=3364070 RepID=UPI003815A04B
MVTEGDLSWMLMLSGMVGVEMSEAMEDEHLRFQIYRRTLRDVKETEEEQVLGIIGRDSDATMGEAAVVEYVDAIGATETDYEAFRTKTRKILQAVPEFDFLARRVDEWEVALRSATDAERVLEAILGGTDWLQRKLANESVSRTVLAALATEGRTKRVRNGARERCGTLGLA